MKLEITADMMRALIDKAEHPKYQRYTVVESTRNENIIIILDNLHPHNPMIVCKENIDYCSYYENTYIDNPFEISDINVDTDPLIRNLFLNIVQYNQSLNVTYKTHLDKLWAVRNSK